MVSFETKRLLCFSLNSNDYEVFASGGEPTWIGFTNPYGHLIEGPNPLPYRIPKVRENPKFAELGLIVAALKSSREIIGSAGFHDFPDSQGMIEIGFGIVPEKQRNGYGTELLLGMWMMIGARSDVKILRYTVSPTNLPSMRIINKLEFEKVGEQVDPEDGLELIYERRKDEFLRTLII